MLVLTRKVGEDLLIGTDICVRVISRRGSQVRLGITAPVHVPIRRIKTDLAAAGKTNHRLPASKRLVSG